MGQYYTPLIKRNDEYTAYDTGAGYKLAEQSWIGSVPDKLATLLYKKPAEFAWVGDYANKNEWEKSFHSHAHGADINKISLDEFDTMDITDKYIVNHTKHEYINMKSYMEKVENDSYGQMHPLSLMTAIGNGRGGGDYSSPVNQDKIGSWAGNVISIEDEAPQNFKELDVWFSKDEDLIEKWEQKSKGKNITFEIKDYLLDNNIGYKSEVDSDKELFNNIDITSEETIMQSLKRVELKINSDVLEIIENVGLRPDWSNDWINFYVNCNCNGSCFEVEAILVTENKETGEEKEDVVSLTEEEASELEKAIKRQLWLDSTDIRCQNMYIDNIIKATEEIEDIGADNLVVTEFGELNVTIKISKNIDEGFEPDYDIDVYAPQPKGKLLSENKLWLGSECNLEKTGLFSALEKIKDGSFVITTNSVRGKTSTVKEALAKWNKPYEHDYS